jgi:hypothetical protein
MEDLTRLGIVLIGLPIAVAVVGVILGLVARGATRRRS